MSLEKLPIALWLVNDDAIEHDSGDFVSEILINSADWTDKISHSDLSEVDGDNGNLAVDENVLVFFSKNFKI